MLKGPVQQDIPILNAYASNYRAAKYVKQKLTEQKEVEIFTIIAGDFNTSSH